MVFIYSLTVSAWQSCVSSPVSLPQPEEKFMNLLSCSVMHLYLDEIAKMHVAKDCNLPEASLPF